MGGGDDDDTITLNDFAASRTLQITIVPGNFDGLSIAYFDDCGPARTTPALKELPPLPPLPPPPAEPDADWSATRDLLAAYMAEHGCFPPMYTSYHGCELGAWARAQRRAYKAKGSRRISPERAAALEAVPGWSWRSKVDTVWAENYAALCAYVAEYGCLPETSTIYRGRKLSAWIRAQRYSRKGQSGRMTVARAAALEAVPGWSWGYLRGARWEIMYRLLCRYVHEFGCLPKTSVVYRGQRLGKWVLWQRRVYWGVRSRRLGCEQIEALGAIPGWEW